jgi:hypothetical protein
MRRKNLAEIGHQKVNRTGRALPYSLKTHQGKLPCILTTFFENYPVSVLPYIRQQGQYTIALHAAHIFSGRARILSDAQPRRVT